MKSIISKYKALPVQLRSSFWFLICSFMQKGISVISTPVFTRLLSTTEYGNFSTFNSWQSIVTVIVTLHMYSSVFQQGLVKFEDDNKVFASSVQGLSFTLVCIWTGIYLCTKSIWNSIFDLTTVQVLAMLVMIWTSTVFNLWSTTQRVEYKYRLLVLITLIVSIAKPGLGVVFVIFAKDKVTARILGLLIVELIGYSWMYISQLKNGKVFYSRKYWVYAVQFNLPLVPHYLSQIVLSNTDRIMIKSMVGASEAGIYSVAYSLSMIMTLFNTALLQTMTPWMYKKIKANKASDISGIAYISLTIIAVLNLMLIAFAPEAIAIFAPKTYYDAIYVIPPVAMSVFFLFLYSLFSNFEFYYEKRSWMMIASVAGAIMNLVLNSIFIRVFGYIAAGYTTLFCYIVYAIGHYIIMSKICKSNMPGVIVYEKQKLLLLGLSFMALGFVLLFLYRYTLIRYIFILCFVGVMIIKRKDILEKIKMLISLKQKKDIVQ